MRMRIVRVHEPKSASIQQSSSITRVIQALVLNEQVLSFPRSQIESLLSFGSKRSLECSKTLRHWL
jgi:hypothetical protein